MAFCLYSIVNEILSHVLISNYSWDISSRWKWINDELKVQWILILTLANINHVIYIPYAITESRFILLVLFDPLLNTLKHGPLTSMLRVIHAFDYIRLCSVATIHLFCLTWVVLHISRSSDSQVNSFVMLIRSNVLWLILIIL